MKKITLILLVVTIQTIYAQQPYYDDVDLTLTGQDLFYALQTKISDYNTTFDYGDVRDTMKITDEDTSNPNNVLLIYGFDDTGSCKTDRTRDKNDYGGSVCEFNREHVFARSNSNPSMGDGNNNYTGIVADPHNIRSSDQQMNGDRGNKKFAAGSGNSGNSGSDWYPGDEWKGDVARMMMYMYTRYENQCLPSLNGTGATQGSTEMLQIYLQWNVEDPVNEFEDQRNPHLQNVYGNRNPFIDNPYLATIIWGGEDAEDRWNLFSIESNPFENLLVYPNPAVEVLWLQSSTIINNGSYIIYDLLGREMFQNNLISNKTSIDISTLTKGLYLLKIKSGNSETIRKIIIE